MHFIYRDTTGAGELAPIKLSCKNVYLNGRRINFVDDTIPQRLAYAITQCRNMAKLHKIQTCTEFALFMSGTVYEPYVPTEQTARLSARVSKDKVTSDIRRTRRLLVLGDGSNHEDGEYAWPHIVVPAFTDKGGMVLHKLGYGNICLSGIEQALDRYDMTELREVETIEVVSTEDGRTLARYE